MHLLERGYHDCRVSRGNPGCLCSHAVLSLPGYLCYLYVSAENVYLPVPAVPVWKHSVLTVLQFLLLLPPVSSASLLQVLPASAVQRKHSAALREFWFLQLSAVFQLLPAVSDSAVLQSEASDSELLQSEVSDSVLLPDFSVSEKQFPELSVPVQVLPAVSETVFFQPPAFLFCSFLRRLHSERDIHE